MKHQRGIVGADLAAIAARRNQTTQARLAQRTAAIQKAKAEKKEKEEKKEKAKVRHNVDSAAEMRTKILRVQPARAPVAGGPKVSKAQMKGSKAGR